MIDFTSLFTTLGKVGKLFNANNAYALSIGSSANTIYTTATEYYAQLNNLNTDSQTLQGFAAGYNAQTLQQIAINILIEAVTSDTPQIANTTYNCLVELINQMIANTESILSNTVSASTSADATNIGTGQVICSLQNFNGSDAFATFQMPFAESVTINCINDSFTGTATAGNETFSISGVAADPAGELDFNFPQGSGATININAIDALVSVTNGNLLTNGAFQDFTVLNTPDQWSIIAGTAGTEIFEDTVHPYTGTSDVKFVGTGTNPVIQQLFNNDTLGTTLSLAPLTPYSVACWMRSSASSTTGSVTFELYDTATSAVIQDNDGNNNSFTLNLNTLTTTYAPVSMIFTTPRQLPATYALRIAFTTIESTHDIYLGQLAMSSMSQLYSNGPLFAIFSGVNTFILNDNYSTTIANSYASLWCTFFEQFFNLNSQGLILPNLSSGETISDSLLS